MKHTIALSMLVAVVAEAQTTFPSEPHVYVEGSAEIEVQPDLLRLSGTMAVVDMNASTAEQEVQQRSATLLAVTREQGIPAEGIRASTISITPTYDYIDGQEVFLGYSVSRNVRISISAVDNYYPTIRAIVESGALEALDAVFSYSDVDGILRQVQRAALDDARSRAASLAERANARLGDVYSISEFDLRQDEEYFLLTPDRRLYEGSLGPEGGLALAAASVDLGAAQLFQADTLTASARVYVVYRIRP